MMTMPASPESEGRALTKEISVVSVTSVDSRHSEHARRGRGERKVKFGTGRNSKVELVPQPSDLPTDPLNWPQWKKELAFGSLLLASAAVGAVKTMLVTVNSVIATEFGVSYTGATALTGVPMIIAGIAGLGSGVLAQRCGKRAIYLVSGLFTLAGLVWNMQIMSSYASFMASRVFQAVGWGATEALVAASIKDLFFLHERNARLNHLNFVALLFSWGSPILGGHLSQSSSEFRNNISFITILQAVAFVFLIFATPETTFHRSTVTQSQPSPRPETTYTSIVSAAHDQPSASKFKSYLSNLSLTTPHSTASFQPAIGLLPLRALAAPSTLLTLLLTAPLVASAQGLSHTISLIFAAMPTFLFPSRIGFLFIAPLILTLLLTTLASFLSIHLSRPPNHLSTTRHLSVAFPGILVGVAGLLSFGFYASAQLIPSDTRTVFTLASADQFLSLKVVSVLLALLVSGASVLAYAGSQQLLAAVSLSPSQAASLESAHRILQDVFSGIFIMAFPSWVQAGADVGMRARSGEVVAGLKVTSMIICVVQFCVGSTVGAVIWTKGRDLTRIDKRVLGVARKDGSGRAVKTWPRGSGRV